MVQGDFHAAIGTKSIRLSGGQFRFVVQALNRACGNLAAGAKPVEEQGPVPTQHPRDLLDGIESGAHDLGTPAVEELAGPRRGVVGPEGLKVLAQERGAHRLEIVADEVAQAARSAGVRWSRRLSSNQRVLVRSGCRPWRRRSCTSARRTASMASPMCIAIWKRSRMCSAWPAFLATTLRYGFHMSLHTKRSACVCALPNQRKNRSSVFTRRSGPIHSSRFRVASTW